MYRKKYFKYKCRIWDGQNWYNEILREIYIMYFEGILHLFLRLRIFIMASEDEAKKKWEDVL